MRKELLIAVGAGVLAGLLFRSAVLGGLGALILANLSALPLYAAGLGLGLAAAAAAALGGSLAVLALGGLAEMAGFMALFAVPALVLTRQALLRRDRPDGGPEWYPAGPMLCWLIAIASSLFLAATLLTANQPNGLVGVLEDSVVQFLTAFDAENAFGTPLGEERIQVLAGRLSYYLPAGLAWNWSVVALANLALAQGALVRLRRNLRPWPDIVGLRLPRGLAFVLFAAVALRFAPGTLGFVGNTLALILVMPYFLQGLAVVHSLARGRPGATFILVGTYLLLLLLQEAGFALVFGLGLVEQWVELRRRFAGRGGKESE